MRILLALALVLAAASGCASQLTLVPKRGFVEPLGNAHALTGRIYAVARRGFVSAPDLEAAVTRARFLVLGETHDNRDHHALEAELIDWFLQAHAPAAVGFEMLDEDQRGALEHPPDDADALARAVRWQDRGWPEFSQYRPVFQVALRRGAKLVAAHPSRERVKASMSAVSEAESRRLRLDPPLAAPAQAQLEQEIRAAHCGHASAAMLTAMVRAQSYKDAFMARALVAADAPSVLVTGRGHARKDRAVPLYLQRNGATGIVSVAFIDVEDAQRAPEAYDISPYDYVIFTPRVSDEDPCRRFEEQLKNITGRPA